MRSYKTDLALGVAGAALAIAIASQSRAACSTDGSTATCSNAVTVDEVNAAMNGVAGDDVTLKLDATAAVSPPSGFILPTKPGAVAIENNGAIGTADNPAGVRYIGIIDAATNRFDLRNIGSIAGALLVNGVGGTVDIRNSGSISDQVSVSARGAVNVVTTGDVGVRGTPDSASALRAVNATSRYVPAATVETKTDTVDDVTTTVTTSVQDATGAASSVTVGENAATGSVTATGHTAATVDVAGAVGAEDQSASARAVSVLAGGQDSFTETSVSGGATDEHIYHRETRTTGGDAAVNVAATGSVSSLVSAAGLKSAKLAIDGVVGLEGGAFTSTATALGTENIQDYSNKSAVDGSSSSTQQKQKNRRTGGDATVTTGKSAVVNGHVTARADGDATVTNAGHITGNALAQAQQYVGNADYSYSDQTKTEKTATGSVVTDTTSTHSLSTYAGKAAAVNNLRDAAIDGSASASGLASAGIVNAGSIGGNASATSTASEWEYQSDQETRTTYVSDPDAGDLVTSVESKESQSSYYRAIGGAGSIDNSGEIEGSATVYATDSASLSNSGEIGGNAFLSAKGVDTADILVSRTNSQTYVVEEGASRLASTADAEERTITATAAGGSATLVNSQGGVIGDGPANSVTLQADKDATATNAGVIDASLSLTARSTGNSSTTKTTDAKTYTADGLETQKWTSSTADTSTATGGSAMVSNAKGGLIGKAQDAPVNLLIAADQDANLENAGRINGNVQLYATSSATTHGEDISYETTYDPVTGELRTSSYAYKASDTSTATGGDATLVNKAGAILVGSANLQANGDVSINNAGLVTGYTSANTYGADTASVDTYDEKWTMAADGSYTRVTTQSATSISTPTGGDVSGIYSGVNGAYQYAPTGASDGSVYQHAAGDSTALVTGTIIGNFSGNSYAQSVDDSDTNGSTTTFTAASATAPHDVETFASTTDGGKTTTNVGGDSTLTVNGGKITGSAWLSADGDATAALGNKASIEGSLTLWTTDTIRTVEEWHSSETWTRVDDDLTARQYDSTNSTKTERGLGAVSATIGDATVGGNVYLDGGAGAVGFDLATAGEVGGSVTVRADAEEVATTNTETGTTDADGDRSTSLSTRTSVAAGGNVTANIAGLVGNGLEGAVDDASGGYGSVSLSTNKGDATATVTGQVGNAIQVSARGADTTRETGYAYADDALASSHDNWTSTATGGKATLTIDSATGKAPVNFGDIRVGGFSGSTVTISADSEVLGRAGGASMTVGLIDYDSTYSTSEEYPADALGSSTTSQTWKAVGGASVLTNAGQIGHDGGAGYPGTGADVNVLSATSATATNSGSIFGSIDVRALASNSSIDTVNTNLGDVTQTSTRTTTYTPSGGAASLVNGRLITGVASIAGATGMVTNNGVIRGSISAGQSVYNHVTQAVDTVSQIGEDKLQSVNQLFNQTYTINQNGLVGGAVTVDGAFAGIEDANGDPVKTSNIVATVNLNPGSVTVQGVQAEFDEETGERFTATQVNLVDNGWLGLNDAGVKTLKTAFASYDPAIKAAKDLGEYVGSARVLGVDRLVKSGAGVFTIVAEGFRPATNADETAHYSLDVGEFSIQGGEIQLATGTDEVIGIRGNLTNAASLVLGTRVDIPPSLFASNLTSSGAQGIAGVAIEQKGNFTQTAAGSLTVGLMPSLVRVTDSSVNSTVLSTEPLATQQVMFSKGLFTTPENALGTAFGQLSPSSVKVDGDLVLNGSVRLVSPTGGIFTNGQSIDLFDVSGKVTENATAVSSAANNFVSFDVVSKAGGSGTLVQVVASRKGYDSAAGNANGAAAGAALNAALPAVVSALKADASGKGNFTSVSQFSLTQDLATVMAGLDSQMSATQAAQVVNELGGGSYYGSLAAIRTTSPFVDVISNRRLPLDARGFNLWIQPTGDFARIGGNTTSGASRIHADNYGLSGGFGVASGAGEFGIGFGYGRIDSHSDDGWATASADSYMVGIYARHGIDQFTVSGDLVFGWSNWKVQRDIPSLFRQANAAFDSKEVRGDLRVEYDFPMSGAVISPFAQIELRHYSFDGFSEEGAGAVGLAVQESSKTVFTPAIGVKVGTEWDTEIAKLRPEASLSYNFKGDIASERTVAFLGSPTNSFRLQGVEPDGFVTMQLGLFADIGDRSGAYVRGSYSTGGGNSVAAVRAGVVIGF